MSYHTPQGNHRWLENSWKYVFSSKPYWGMCYWGTNLYLWTLASYFHPSAIFSRLHLTCHIFQNYIYFYCVCGTWPNQMSMNHWWTVTKISCIRCMNMFRFWTKMTSNNKNDHLNDRLFLSCPSLSEQSSWWTIVLHDIHGLWCRSLPAHGDVDARWVSVRLLEKGGALAIADCTTYYWNNLTMPILGYIPVSSSKIIR